MSVGIRKNGLHAIKLGVNLTSRQPNQSHTMTKAYWISTYHAISDPSAVAEYAKLAGPALTAAGAKFLARGMPSVVYEAGIRERTVLIEFESVAQAVAAHDSPAYQEALAALGDGAKRDMRIIESAA